MGIQDGFSSPLCLRCRLRVEGSAARVCDAGVGICGMAGAPLRVHANLQAPRLPNTIQEWREHDKSTCFAGFSDVTNARASGLDHCRVIQSRTLGHNKTSSPFFRSTQVTLLARMMMMTMIALMQQLHDSL